MLNRLIVMVTMLIGVVLTALCANSNSLPIQVSLCMLAWTFTAVPIGMAFGHAARFTPSIRPEICRLTSPSAKKKTA